MLESCNRVMRVLVGDINNTLSEGKRQIGLERMSGLRSAVTGPALPVSFVVESSTRLDGIIGTCTHASLCGGLDGDDGCDDERSTTVSLCAP